MYTIAQVAAGANNYIQSEIVGQLTDWRKWVIGAGAEMLVANIAETFSEIKNKKEVQLMKVIDENDHIDVDKLYRYFLGQAKKGSVTFNVPVLGPITLHESDVEKIYRCILAGGATT